tara:strand:+ start:891 stop:1226 length:336 start_codon:yes stop_codon:yes gene_type:complete
MQINNIGIRTEIHKTFGGRFVRIVYQKANGEIKTYHGKFEGKEKDFTNKKDTTAKDNIVFNVFEKKGKRPVHTRTLQLILSGIESIFDSQNTCILNVEYRPHLETINLRSA